MIAGLILAVLVGLLLYGLQFVVKPVDVKKLYEEAQEKEDAKQAGEKVTERTGKLPGRG